MLNASEKKEIKRIIEALLFSMDEPLELEKIRAILEPAFPLARSALKQLIEELQFEYRHERRAFQLDEIGGGYILRTVKELHPFIEHLQPHKRSEKLSKASLEVLATIAYKQPITRAEIDKLRGVDSSGTIASLLDRNLITITARLDAPGRPAQYSTTTAFLQHFGLNSVEEIRGTQLRGCND